MSRNSNELKGLESLLISFVGLLTGTSNTAIVAGDALVKLDNHELRRPDSREHYSGRQSTGEHVLPAATARTGAVRLIYGFTKWRPPSRHKSGDKGYVNFDWQRPTTTAHSHQLLE
jgi:hypothetical protein